MMNIIAQDSLPSKANVISSCNENILNDINKLSSLNEEILNFWDGVDAQSFVTKINEFIPGLNKLYDAISDYSEFLSKVNTVFNSIDNYYDKEIDV